MHVSEQKFFGVLPKSILGQVITLFLPGSFLDWEQPDSAHVYTNPYNQGPLPDKLPIDGCHGEFMSSVYLKMSPVAVVFLAQGSILWYLWDSFPSLGDTSSSGLCTKESPPVCRWPWFGFSSCSLARHSKTCFLRSW